MLSIGMNTNSVVTFHKITNGVWFENVICFLKSRYRLVSIESLHAFYAGVDCLTNSCHIAVDDGDRSFYEVIFPVLLKHRAPASLFVSPKTCITKTNFWFQEIEGYDQLELKRLSAETLNVSVADLMRHSVTTILKGMTIKQIKEVIRRYQQKAEIRGKGRQNITIDALREIDKSGLVSIGAHTLNHPILKNEDDSTCEHEISESVTQLSKVLKKEIRYFAYPNGIPALDFAEREVKCLRNIGIRLAFTTESRHLTLSDDLMQVPRIQISCNESILSIRAKLFLGSKWNTLKKIKMNGEYAERSKLRKLIESNH